MVYALECDEKINYDDDDDDDVIALVISRTTVLVNNTYEPHKPRDMTRPTRMVEI